MAHADIIGPLDPPSTLGHKYCLTVVDACTRWCWCSYNTIQYNIRNLCTPSLTVKNRHESAMDVP